MGNWPLVLNTAEAVLGPLYVPLFQFGQLGVFSAGSADSIGSYISARRALLWLVEPQKLPTRFHSQRKLFGTRMISTTLLGSHLPQYINFS